MTSQWAGTLCLKCKQEQEGERRGRGGGGGPRGHRKWIRFPWRQLDTAGVGVSRWTRTKICCFVLS